MNLAELLGTDPNDADDETLVAGIRDAERIAGQAVEWSGQMIRILKARHSWTEVVILTGMPQTTLHNRVNPRPRKTAQPPADQQED